MNKSRILFMVQLPPPVHGASQMNQFLVQSQALNNKYDITVLNLDFVTSVDDIGKFSLTKVYKMFNYLWKLLKTLLRNKYQMVYFTLSPVGGAFYRDAFYVFFLKLIKSKLVYHLHGKGILEEIQNPVKKAIYKYVFKNANIICLSELLHYDIQDIVECKIYDVPNGIPVEQISVDKRNPKEIVYLSALKKSKGILDFVQALRLLDARNIKFQAKIIGSSSKDMTVEQLKSLLREYGIDDKVKVLGPIYGKEKFRELSKSAIFCFPTFYRNECFPLSILEAMMMGVVPVSTKNGAISEIIDHGENGMIAEINNPKDCSEVLEELLENQDKLMLMSNNAQKKFYDLYTIEKFEEKIDEVFEDILNQTYGSC